MDKLIEANRKTTLFAQIETREGIDNANAIAAVDGVDCLWIGHFDLSASLGIPGQFGHKDFAKAVAAVAKACKQHKKSLGRLVPTVDEGVELYRQGFDFICYSGDVWALHGAVSAGVAAIRERTARERTAEATNIRSRKKKT